MRGKSLIQCERVKRSEHKGSEVCGEAVRKSRYSDIMNPYRKPTQVDEERILRPTEEALLRNSAK